MTTRTELEKQITEAQKQVNELNASIAAMSELVSTMPVENEGIWVPKDGDKYWFVTTYGTVASSTRCEEEPTFYNGRISIGNVFRTREEAERHLERLKVLQELRVLAKGFKPDWGDVNQYKLRLHFCHTSKKWNLVTNTVIQSLGAIYFRTEADAQTAIDTLGDRLNVLLEG